VKYNPESGYYESNELSYEDDDLHDIFIDDYSLETTQKFLNRNEELKDKLFPLISKLKSVYRINRIVLTNQIIDSEYALELQEELPEDKLNDLLSRYFDTRIGEFEQKAEKINKHNSSYIDLPPRFDLEEKLFFPLRQFLYHNPKIATKYRDTQKALKLKAFDLCGRSEDTFTFSSGEYSDWYLTSGWLRDVKNRFPEILERGLDLYLFQKLRQSQVYRYVRNDDDSYNSTNVLVNIESEVFKRIQEFEEENKSLFEKHSKNRMICIKAFIDNAQFNDLLDSAFFFRLERTFRPTFYRVIFKKYVDKKLKFIQETEFRKKQSGIEHDDYVDEYRKISDKDVYGYIFDPLEEFIEAHPELIQEYGEETKDLQYQFLVNYLTNKTVSTDIKNRALKYLRYLNNNEADNSVTYSKIINELRHSFEDNKKSAHKVLDAYKEFYTKIEDKETLRDIFSNGINKSHLYVLISVDTNNNLIWTDPPREYDTAIHELIKSKIKTSKLPYSNPNSFYKMLNRIMSNNVIDLILKETLTQNFTRVPFEHILKLFFEILYVYDYINDNKELKDNLYKLLNSDKITNIDLQGIINNRKENSLSRFFEFIMQNPDYENIKAYKMAIDYDQKQIEKYQKEIQNSKNNTIDHRYMNLFFFKTPPNLRNAIISSSYSSETTIKIKSIFPIESLNFLPKVFQKPSTIDISDCVLKNNIDYIPSNTNRIDLNNVTVSPDKDLIKKADGSFDSVINQLVLNSIKNLKTLKGLNNLIKLNSLSIQRCDDLVSLKGSPSNLIDFTITSCNNIKNFKGGPIQVKNNFKVNSMQGLVNFVGTPVDVYMYTIYYTRINSFKGLPNYIRNLRISDSVSHKNLIRKKYSYFPNRIKHLDIVDYEITDDNKSAYSRYLFSKILDVFPSYIGNIENFLKFTKHSIVDNEIKLDKNFPPSDPFWKKVYNIYIKNFDKFKNKNQEEIESAQRIKQERTPTKEDELEAIEAQQDKAANKERKRFLKKESVELVTPFNNLMENILNNIVTSFKVYK
jgi:hypothetical protein